MPLVMLIGFTFAMTFGMDERRAPVYGSALRSLSDRSRNFHRPDAGLALEPPASRDPKLISGPLEQGQRALDPTARLVLVAVLDRDPGESRRAPALLGNRAHPIEDLQGDLQMAAGIRQVPR